MLRSQQWQMPSKWRGGSCNQVSRRMDISLGGRERCCGQRGHHQLFVFTGNLHWYIPFGFHQPWSDFFPKSGKSRDDLCEPAIGLGFGCGQALSPLPYDSGMLPTGQNLTSPKAMVLRILHLDHLTFGPQPVMTCAPVLLISTVRSQ